jgi:outer membrane protein assembly factor BamE (lipoprotein component of BamABCDE complex)
MAASNLNQHFTNGRTMARTKIFLIAASSAAILLSGCATTRAAQGYIADPTLVDGLAVGVDNKDSVEKALGRPTFTGQFSANDWYYFSRTTRQLAFNNPKAKDQTVIRMQFDSAGNLAAINKKGMEGVVNISPDGDKTPTLGKERSFFEELFGNIGVAGAGGGGGG